MDGPDWKALWDFLRLLDTSWVATADKKVQPWTGGWPKHTTVLYLERGGILHEHIKRWLDLAKSGDDVEIRDQCASACTLIMAFVPRERICFGKYSSLLFHAVRNAPDMRIDVSATVWMFNQYPGDIREWLGERGGLAVGDVVASALDLWVLGYRQCAPDPDPNSQEGRERRANDWEEWRKSNEPPDPNEVPIPMTIMKSTKMEVGG